MEKDFGIVCDIDGVVYKAREILPGSKEAIGLIQKNEIPMMFITNDGGMQESKKAKLMSDLCETKIDVDQVILSHTPFKDLGRDYWKKRVLVIGVKRDECFKVMKNYGFENVVFFDDYLDERPYLLNFYCPRNENPDPNQRIVSKEEVIQEEPFGAIFVLHEPTNWYTGLQLSIDILSSNGYVGKKVNYREFKDYNIPIFVSNPDLEYSGKFYTPRLTAGAFAVCIKSVFESKTGQELKNLVQCGKPLRYPFEYVERKLEKQTRFYLIGDNPKSDICGANKRENWTSVLVRTGCHQLPGNDPINPADFVCDDLLEAIKLILRKEKIIMM